MSRCLLWWVLLCLLAAAVTPTLCSRVSGPVPVLAKGSNSSFSDKKASVANLQEVIVIISNPSTTAPAPYPGATGSSKGTKTIIVDSIDDLDQLAKSVKQQKGQQKDDAPTSGADSDDRGGTPSGKPGGSSKQQQQGKHDSQSEREMQAKDRSSSSSGSEQADQQPHDVDDTHDGGDGGSDKGKGESRSQPDDSDSEDTSREGSKQTQEPGGYGDSNREDDRGQHDVDPGSETLGNEDHSSGDDSSDRHDHGDDNTTTEGHSNGKAGSRHSRPNGNRDAEDVEELQQEQQQSYRRDGKSNTVPRFPQKYFPRMVGDDGEEGDTGHRDRGHQHQQQDLHQPRADDGRQGMGDRPHSYDADDADQPDTNSRGGHHDTRSGRGNQQLHNHDSMYDETHDASPPHQGQYDGGRGKSEGQHSAGRGDRDSSPPEYDMYPSMEEPGPYYQQPELHTTCLQVIKATQDTQGRAL